MQKGGSGLKQFHLFWWFDRIAGDPFFELLTGQARHPGQPPQLSEFKEMPLFRRRPHGRVTLQLVGQQAGASTREDDEIFAPPGPDFDAGGVLQLPMQADKKCRPAAGLPASGQADICLLRAGGCNPVVNPGQPGIGRRFPDRCAALPGNPPGVDSRSPPFRSRRKQEQLEPVPAKGSADRAVGRSGQSPGHASCMYGFDCR